MRGMVMGYLPIAINLVTRVSGLIIASMDLGKRQTGLGMFMKGNSIGNSEKAIRVSIPSLMVHFIRVGGKMI